MEPDRMDLPESITEIAEIIGLDATFRLIRAMEPVGSRAWRICFYVPKLRRLEVDHVLVRVLGWHDARRLCRHFGGEILQPSNCRFLDRRARNRRIRMLRAEGFSVREITRQLEIEQMEVTHDVVRKVVAGNPPEDEGNASSRCSGETWRGNA